MVSIRHRLDTCLLILALKWGQSIINQKEETVILRKGRKKSIGKNIHCYSSAEKLELFFPLQHTAVTT